MFTNLSPGAIGVRDLTLPQAITLAGEQGFAGVEVNIRQASALGIDQVRQLLADAGVRGGSWGLPINWASEDGPPDQAALDELGRLAELGRDLGCTRVTGVVRPFSDLRRHEANWRFHVERLGPVAAVLATHDCRLGLEFIGPKTLRDEHAHPFVYALPEMMELARATGSNVGLLLDAYHLYTSGGTLAELDTIHNQDVVVVHVNDAIAGVPRDEQLDLVRAMPLETGVIDLVGFMQRLAGLGYDGPVTVEPFSKTLNEVARVDPAGAARITADSLARLWAAAGLA